MKPDRGDFEGAEKQQPGRREENHERGITEVRREFPEGRSGSMSPEAPRRISESRIRKQEVHLATKRYVLYERREG